MSNVYKMGQFDVPMEEQIDRIEIITNVEKINYHKLDLPIKVVDIMVISLHNYGVRVLDLSIGWEMTTCDYIEYRLTKKSKIKTLFAEDNMYK